jgi:beta-lactam-binding protein with PASTA domain
LTAAATLGRNFQVETQQEESDTVAVGAVIRTDPPTGTKVARQRCHDGHLGGHPGDNGPDLVGLTQSAALDRLTRLVCRWRRSS